MKIISLFVIVVFALPFFVDAQIAKKNINGNDDDPYEHLNYFMCGLNYQSDNVYLGRKDTIVIPYYSPYIGYHFSSGLYAKALISYTTAGTDGGHIDLTTLEAGYDHDFGKINAGINAEKFFYYKNSINIRANTVGCIGIDGQYSNDWVEPSILFDVNFNKNSQDYVLGTAIDHNFSLDDDKLNIIPTITMISGTQNYYDEYFTNRLTKKDKTIKVKHVVADASKFNILDYEISVKATYRIKQWLFTLKPTYSIAESPAQITLPGNRTMQEKISNSFYVELDICFRAKI